jgi:hypothetical protein
LQGSNYNENAAVIPANEKLGDIMGDNTGNLDA